MSNICGCCGGEIFEHEAWGEIIRECYGCSGVVGAFGCAKASNCKIEEGQA